jgi:hypothetical protein
MKARMFSQGSRRVPTNFRSEGRRLLRAAVAQDFRKFSAEPT